LALVLHVAPRRHSTAIVTCFFEARLNIGSFHNLVFGEKVMVRRCLECGYDNSEAAEVCVGCGSLLIDVSDGKGGPGPVAVNVPPGTGAVRTATDVLKIRGPPRARLGFALCFVATILVTLNGLLVGLAGYSVPIPVAMFPLTFSNVAMDIVALVIGFAMLIGSLLILARREVYGSATMIVLSLLSLAIGGGFVIGFLVGLIGAFVGLLKK